MQSPRQKVSISRHEDFWFSDGSVVLVVENTAFRIHQSILSRYSDVFADMFTVPQPDLNDEDHLDGCPIVHLTDPLEDFVDVMKAIYEPFYFDNLAPNAELPTLLSFISGILRISTKYNLQLLREKCIGVLRTKFPSTLAGCDALLSSGYQYVSSAIVRAIPLARESNVPEILPWAFYISTHIAADALLADPFLSWQDKALCLAGKDRLWNAQIKHTHQFVFDFTRSAACIGACRGGAPQTLTWQEMEALRVSPHPLDHYEKWNTLKVCPKCLAHVEQQHQMGRMKVEQSTHVRLNERLLDLLIKSPTQPPLDPIHHISFDSHEAKSRSGMSIRRVSISMSVHVFEHSQHHYSDPQPHRPNLRSLRITSVVFRQTQYSIHFATWVRSPGYRPLMLADLLGGPK